MPLPHTEDRSTIYQSQACYTRTTSMQIPAGTWADCR